MDKKNRDHANFIAFGSVSEQLLQTEATGPAMQNMLEQILIDDMATCIHVYPFLYAVAKFSSSVLQSNQLSLLSSLICGLHSSNVSNPFISIDALEVLEEINFFKPSSYIIEALCANSYEDATHNLKDVEAQILRKRNELRQFEAEYRKVFLWK